MCYDYYYFNTIILSNNIYSYLIYLSIIVVYPLCTPMIDTFYWSIITHPELYGHTTSIHHSTGTIFVYGGVRDEPLVSIPNGSSDEVCQTSTTGCKRNKNPVDGSPINSTMYVYTTNLSSRQSVWIPLVSGPRKVGHSTVEIGDRYMVLIGGSLSESDALFFDMEHRNWIKLKHPPKSLIHFFMIKIISETMCNV